MSLVHVESLSGPNRQECIFLGESHTLRDAQNSRLQSALLKLARREECQFFVEQDPQKPQCFKHSTLDHVACAPRFKFANPPVYVDVRSQCLREFLPLLTGRATEALWSALGDVTKTEAAWENSGPKSRRRLLNPLIELVRVHRAQPEMLARALTKVTSRHLAPLHTTRGQFERLVKVAESLLELVMAALPVDESSFEKFQSHGVITSKSTGRRPLSVHEVAVCASLIFLPFQDLFTYVLLANEKPGRILVYLAGYLHTQWLAQVLTRFEWSLRATSKVLEELGLEE